MTESQNAERLQDILTRFEARGRDGFFHADIEFLLARNTELRDALAALVDDEEGDLSTCPYFTRHLPGGDPKGTCGFGCVDEPQCMTCRPLDGWPMERARAVLDKD